MSSLASKDPFRIHDDLNEAEQEIVLNCGRDLCHLRYSCVVAVMRETSLVHELDLGEVEEGS